MSIVEDAILLELKENIVDDVLNFSDPSVGIFEVCDLESWAKDEFHHLSGVELVSASKDSLTFTCEGDLFTIFSKVYTDGKEVIHSEWAIKRI